MPKESQFKIDQNQLEHWYKLPISERNTKNNKVIDELLLGWNRMKIRAAKKPLPGLAGFHVIFFHIPKTGGTTLDYLTAKNYRIDYVYQVNAPAFDQHVSGVFKNKAMARVLMGHYELNDYYHQLFDRKKLVQFTMIREPISRVVSYYDYLRTSPNHPKYSIAKDLSLKEFVLHKDIDEMPNGQTFRILGMLRDNLWKNTKKTDLELIDEVKYQLEHRFSLFGLTEFYDDFLVMAQRTLGWNDIFYERMNSSKEKTDKSSIPNEVIEIIKEQNSIDIELYNFAKELFKKRFDELGLSTKHVEEYKNLNKKYNELKTQQIQSTLNREC